jgi:hypothetical protein
MSHLDILIPFGLPPAELAADLFREFNAPAFGMLAARSGAEHESTEDFARALPHETWLARRFGLEEALKQHGSPPVAASLMQLHGIPVNAGLWFVAQPVHIHIARDHLVLTDPRQLTLTEKESLALFDIAKPLFAEAGHDLRYGNADCWFLRADQWNELQTSTPDAAGGHNIDLWMPKGPGERAWRKVQNEVQMHWFSHALNANREAQGLKPVNSLWLWGAEDAALPMPAPYTATFNLRGWMRAFSKNIGDSKDVVSAKQIIAAKPEQGLLVLDNLLEAALSNNWAEWLDRLRALEHEWFTPLLKALKAGALSRVSLIITNDTRISRFTVTRSSLRKFWVQPSLRSLCR